MKRWISVMLLICIFSLAGCSGVKKVDLMVNQMRGDTEISSVRTDTLRAGIVWADHQFECTDDGVYYMATAPCQFDNGERTMEGPGNFLFYSPHDSDTFIKLCGRPDCAHNTSECNAYIESPVGGITYYQGHLYYAAFPLTTMKYLFDVYRMNLDGTDRVKVGSYGDGKQFKGAMLTSIHQGKLISTMRGYTSDGEIRSVNYLFSLDESKDKGEEAVWGGAPVKQDNTFLGYYTGEDGEYRECVYQVNLEKNTKTMLFDKEDYPDGYWDSKAGYFLENGKIVKVPYKTGEREVLFEIQQEGNYSARFFPDCIMLIERMSKYEEGTPQLHFYSWEGEYYGVALFTCSRENLAGMDAIVGGETSGKIYLSTTSKTTLPAYYIDKSEFGTGNIQLHPCHYPDLTDEEAADLFGELPQ